MTAEQREPARHRSLDRLPFAPRWLAAGGAAVLAALIGIALLLQGGGSPACAAPPTGSAVHRGKATFYDLGGGTGNCSFPSAPANDLFVALGNSEYSGAAACGSFLDVTGPKGTVRVKVIDRCPECEPGHLDLSRTAFKRIAAEVQGIVPISYRAVVSPAAAGPLSVRIKEGSSQYWFAALIDNHANPLASVRVTSSGGGGARSAQRADYNYWIIDGGAGNGPFTLTTTDVYGHTATASGIKLAPGQTQGTSARFGRAAAPPAPPKVKAPARKPGPAAPRASTSSAATVPGSASGLGDSPPVVAPAGVQPADAPDPANAGPVALAAATDPACG